MSDNVRQLPVAGSWDKERRDLIKRMCCPKGIQDDEFLVFTEQCQRSGLDPLLKQAFCVPRNKNVGTKDRPVYVTLHEFQPAEAGMLARAQKFPDFRGVTAQAVRETDECRIDAGTGEVHHSYIPGAKRGKVIGAWARLARQDKLTIVVWIDFDSYAQKSPTWSAMPDTMIEKCARVAALRRAYAADFGGLYIAEEIHEDEGPVVDAAPTKPAAPTRTETITGKLAAKLGEPLAAKTSRLTIQDESKTPDKPALPPPAIQPTIPAVRPFDALVELAAAQGTTPKELAGRAGLERLTGEKTKRGDVTAADVEAVKAYLAKTEPPEDDIPF